MMTKLRINYPILSTLVYSETDPDIPGIKDNWFRHYSHCLNTTVIYQRHQLYPTPSTTIWATMHGQIRNTRNQRWWSVPYSWEITVCTILSLMIGLRHMSIDVSLTVIYQRHQPYPTPSTTIRATVHGQIRNTRNQRWWLVPYSWEITVLYHFITVRW